VTSDNSRVPLALFALAPVKLGPLRVGCACRGGVFAQIGAVGRLCGWATPAPWNVARSHLRKATED